MKRLAPFAILILVLALGCAAKEEAAAPAPEKYKGLTRVPDIQDGEAWRKPGLTLAHYDRFILEPATLRLQDYDPEKSSISPEQLRELGKYFDQVLHSAVTGGGYPVTTEPGPKTLRISPVITEVEPSNPVMNAVTSVLPFGIAASLVQQAATGKGSFVGETSVEVEFHDALTGELVGVYKGHKVGEKYDSSGFTQTGVSQKAFEEWAAELRERLDLMHGKKKG